MPACRGCRSASVWQQPRCILEAASFILAELEGPAGGVAAADLLPYYLDQRVGLSELLEKCVDLSSGRGAVDHVRHDDDVGGIWKVGVTSLAGCRPGEFTLRLALATLQE